MSLTLETDGETTVVVRRRFAASPERVFRAHIDAALIPRWMTGPEGWTMPGCVIDARPGGSFRFDWAGPGGSFHATGEYSEVVPHSRIVHVERMFLPDATPENHVVTEFHAEGTGTLMVMVMTLPDAKARAEMLATGMADGMEESYARIDGLAISA